MARAKKEKESVKKSGRPKGFFQGSPLDDTRPSRSWSTPIRKGRSDSSLDGSGGNKVDEFSKNMMQMLMMQNERDAKNHRQAHEVREVEHQQEKQARAAERQQEKEQRRSEAKRQQEMMQMFMFAMMSRNGGGWNDAAYDGAIVSNNKPTSTTCEY